MTKLFPGFNHFLLVFFNFQSKTGVDGKTNYFLVCDLRFVFKISWNVDLVM